MSSFRSSGSSRSNTSFPLLRSALSLLGIAALLLQNVVGPLLLLSLLLGGAPRPAQAQTSSSVGVSVGGGAPVSGLAGTSTTVRFSASPGGAPTQGSECTATSGQTPGPWSGPSWSWSASSSGPGATVSVLPPSDGSSVDVKVNFVSAGVYTITATASVSYSSSCGGKSGSGSGTSTATVNGPKTWSVGSAINPGKLQVTVVSTPAPTPTPTPLPGTTPAPIGTPTATPTPVPGSYPPGSVVTVAVTGASDSDHWTQQMGNTTTSGDAADTLKYTWTGATGTGSSVNVTIPASGTLDVSCQVDDTPTAVTSPEVGTRDDGPQTSSVSPTTGGGTGDPGGGTATPTPTPGGGGGTPTPTPPPTPTPTPAPQPVSLTAYATSRSSINLSWDKAPGKLYRSTDPQFTPDDKSYINRGADETDATKLSYSDGGLQYDTTYYYVLVPGDSKFTKGSANAKTGKIVYSLEWIGDGSKVVAGNVGTAIHQSRFLLRVRDSVAGPLPNMSVPPIEILKNGLGASNTSYAGRAGCSYDNPFNPTTDLFGRVAGTFMSGQRTETVDIGIKKLGSTTGETLATLSVEQVWSDLSVDDAWLFDPYFDYDAASPITFKMQFNRGGAETDISGHSIEFKTTRITGFMLNPSTGSLDPFDYNTPDLLAQPLNGSSTLKRSDLVTWSPSTTSSSTGSYGTSQTIKGDASTRVDTVEFDAVDHTAFDADGDN